MAGKVDTGTQCTGEIVQICTKCRYKNKVDVATQCTEESQVLSGMPHNYLNRFLHKRDEIQLELLPAVVLRMIFKMIGLSGLKALRLTSKTLRDKVQEQERKFFKCWDFDKNATYPERDAKIFVKSLSKDVNIITDLRFSIGQDTEGWVEVIKSVLEDHPELEQMHLTIKDLDDREFFCEILAVCRHTLTSLHLKNCHFRDELSPFEKGYLPRLEYFKNTEDIGLEAISIMRSCSSTLKRLELDNEKRFSKDSVDIIPNDIDFPLLEHLDLILCFTDEGLTQLLRKIAENNSTKIKVLKLSGVQDIGEIFSKLPKSLCSDLVELVLNDQILDDKQLLQVLSKMGNKLKILNLSLTQITGEGLDDLGSDIFPQLRRLVLVRCFRLTDRGLATVMRTFGTKLQSLDLRETNISGEEIDERKFKFFPQIDWLGLVRCMELTDRGLATIMRSFGTKLKVLNLKGTNISGEEFCKQKTDSFPRLESLVLKRCKRLTDNGLAAILRVCGTNLKKLNLQETKINGENLQDFCPSLNTLNLTFCSRFTDHGLAKILSRGSNLKILKIGSTKITGEIISTMDLTSFPVLETLDLDDCRGLTDKGFIKIIAKFGSNLKVLNIARTFLTYESFYIISLFPSIKLEDLNMQECEYFSNYDFLQILGRFEDTLVNVDLSDTSISGYGFAESGLHLPNLKKLVITGVWSIDEPALREILSVCGNIKKLAANHVQHMSTEFRNELRTRGIRTSTVDLF